MTTRFMASSLAVAILVAVTGKTGIADFPVVPQYTLIDLGSLDGTRREAFALNDGGTVVGEAGPVNVAHAFQYPGVIVYDSNEISSSANDINAAGIVAGVSVDANGDKMIVWQDGIGSTPLPFAAVSSAAHAINDRNVVAGRIGSIQSSAVTYNLAGTEPYTDIGILLRPPDSQTIDMSEALDINESNVAVGWVIPDVNSFVKEAFRFIPPDAGAVLRRSELYDGYDHVANALNDHGDVVGYCGPRACLWPAGDPTARPTLFGEPLSIAKGISNKGEIVGSFTPAGGSGDRAFIRTSGQMLDLNGLIAANADWVLAVANDINEQSQIVGRAVVNDGSEHAFLLTPTAMPGATNVVATPVDSTTGNIPVKVTFAAITKGGVTTLTTSNSGPEVPANFSAGTPKVYYDIATTASFTQQGRAEVCIDVTGIDFGGGGALSLHHYQSGSWVTVDSTFNSATDVICGSVTSLSTFVVLREVSNAAPVVGDITLDPQPVIIGAAVTAAASFTDADAGDTHSGTWGWGDGSASVASLSAGSATGSHAYTAVGVYTVQLTVIDDERAADISSTNATVIYGICKLYDPHRAVRRGSTFPIKFQICDATGRNLSSPAIVVTAKGIDQISTSAPGQIEDSGNSNADDNFRYESGLGGSGGYIFNLSTASLSTGTYAVRFTVVGAGTYEYRVEFQVK